MSDTPLAARVRAAIAKTFRLSETDARRDLRMSDPPAWDSLGHMDLIAAVEKEFGVRFPGHALGEVVSHEALTKELERLGAK